MLHDAQCGKKNILSFQNQHVRNKIYNQKIEKNQLKKKPRKKERTKEKKTKHMVHSKLPQKFVTFTKQGKKQQSTPFITKK